MERSELNDLAESVVAHRLGRTPLPPLPASLGVDDGYAIQALANTRLAEEFGVRIGYKIGGTTAGMRELLRIEAPVSGEIFASCNLEDGAILRLSDLVRPGVETEIAAVLGQTIPAGDTPWTRETIAGHVEALAAAIEIVDDRYVDFTTAGAATFAADNAFNVAAVVGTLRRDWQSLPLDRLRARTFIDEAAVAEGTADALMGHPLDALCWIANHYGVMGRDLEAGRFVMLGSITPVQWIDRPLAARIEIEELGGVGVRFV